jgi:hypothetical protein
MIRNWQKRRSEFNHDWLKNRYLPALAKCANILDGRVEDPEFETDLPKTLGQWCDHRNEPRLLAEAFGAEMSPRILLDEVPLTGLPAEHRAGLAALVDALWRTRYPVAHWISNLIDRSDAVDAAYNSLDQILRSGAEPSAASVLRRNRSKLVDFHTACQALARAVEEFPSGVLVV